MAELRQRRAVVTDSDFEFEKKPLLRRVAQVDLFPKPKEEFRRAQTATGAYLSALAACLVTLLTLWEIGAYAIGRDAYSTELSVHTSTEPTAAFNFDITFFSIPCHELSVDAMDAAGGLDINVDHDLYKSPVDRNGRLVFHGKYNYVEKRFGNGGEPLPKSFYDEKKDPRSPKFCGSCYIEPEKHHGYDKRGGLIDTHLTTVHKDACCNTCESVMKMYDLHHLPRPSAGEVEQCMHELSHANPGCNIRGTLHLKKVMGNFHFAPGVSALGPMGQHVHQYDFEQLIRFNVSHKINHLSIGDSAIHRFSSRGSHKDPLDGFTYVVRGDHSSLQGHIKYFLQVVPTVYNNSATARRAFEYSAQLFHAEFPLGIGGLMPSVIFVYDFHPIEIHHVFRRPSLSHFFVQLCGIVGGLFVVLGIIDRGIESLAL